MLIAHYLHRLPANHDLAQVRARAAQRIPEWRAMSGLAFKGFLLREAGRFGATANSYSSLYLWRQAEGFRKFLVDGGFEIVTKSFGRPHIDTWNVVDARRGAATEARFASLQHQDIPMDADLTAALAGEIEVNHAASSAPGTVAAAVGIDTRRWSVTRIRLLVEEPAADPATTLFQVLQLARPELDALPG